MHKPDRGIILTVTHPGTSQFQSVGLLAMPTFPSIASAKRMKKPFPVTRCTQVCYAAPCFLQEQLWSSIFLLCVLQGTTETTMVGFIHGRDPASTHRTCTKSFLPDFASQIPSVARLRNSTLIQPVLWM